jgi:integrase
VILFLKREVSKNTCPTAYSAIRFFYEAAEIPFDVKRDDVVSDSIQKMRESLTPDEIRQMITESKKHFGKVDIGFLAAFTNPVFGAVEIGYLLLSTVYGLKRTEIYNITSETIDIDNSNICIKPLKTTDIEKNHIIPTEIMPIMRNFKAGLKKMKNKPPILHYTHLFDGMCLGAGVGLRPRLGWESIRRTLECELAMAGVNEAVIKSFMGMKTKETELLLKGNWKRVDEAVFEKHPFLRAWI